MYITLLYSTYILKTLHTAITTYIHHIFHNHNTLHITTTYTKCSKYFCQSLYIIVSALCTISYHQLPFPSLFNRVPFTLVRIHEISRDVFAHSRDTCPCTGTLNHKFRKTFLMVPL